ncbi:U11/U12 small nuclear ribonucleoprotein 48 kDa protein-like [Anopheles aquasalis]|uniref:U11/U12 small nuclear ribonucleoprotein 48 kDa protein-like n=1 Tax=Anopheles aquasalis TaxID=42839 RepID=UPI00215A1CFE|nr:U11/U12 small nuclear ribonucleoprotein 48 kDa protein-like [Anopheles aquasalis]
MDRKEVIQSLKSFIDDAESRITSILESYGWTKENILQTTVTSQRDANRQVEDSKAPADEEFLPSSYPADSPYSIHMDTVKQAEAILEDFYQNPALELGVPLEDICSRNPPSNLAELQRDFTREERLSLYRHAVENTRKMPEVQDIVINYNNGDSSSGGRGTATLTELAAIERDARRRNLKHRVAKNPLTYTEKIRQLIHLQSETLAKHFHQTNPKPDAEETTKRRKRTHRERSRSRSADRARSKKKAKKRDRSRSRSRHKKRKRQSPSSSLERKTKKHKKKHDR